MRGKLQQTLLENLPVTKDTQVTFDKKLTGIVPSVDGATCQFSDGSIAGPFDLIVGCDGIKSAVKEYIERGKISENDSLREGSAAALYSGIRINYAVQDQPPNFYDNVTMKGPQPLQQVFADGAYAFKGMFGNGKDRPPCQCVFVISLDDKYNGPFRRKISSKDEKQDLSTNDAASENVDWSQDLRGSKEDNREKLLKQIKDAGINDPEADSIVMSADRFFELGVYLHNPFSFSGWSKQIPSSAGSYAVLCGDSAHAMPPFLGQGEGTAVSILWSDGCVKWYDCGSL
jgi:2-polyprenyl-6-methoxyphenol hydroxylase-like FAD-dependent oxidoreductase